MLSVPSETITGYSANPRIDNLIQGIVSELKSFTEEQAHHIRNLADIGVALSAESNRDKVLEMILAQARRFTNADGGTLYLITEDKRELDFHVLHNDTLNSYQGGTSGNPVNLQSVPLFCADGSPNHANVSAHVAIEGKVVSIDNVYEAEGFNFDGPRKFDAAFNYETRSMLVVPMRDHEQEVIGVLQLINAKDRETKITVPFGEEQVSMASALASQAAVVLTQQQLIDELKNLFDSFIQAIATAIDEKSRYTGGHVARVTELTMAMAHKINKTKEGTFAGVSFTEKELEELRIASWLHDTGKITTPEYVVDKSKKLETVFDRIELVKTRWEVIRLQQRLDTAEKMLKTADQHIDSVKRTELEAKLEKKLSALDEDLEFLVRTNTGGEFMADDKLERLNGIAGQSYKTNGEARPFLTNDEVMNLAIRKGTLTDEEREIMNNHVVMSIKILSEIPWPTSMQNVPQIAGSHHEKLDGTGYPDGLKEEEITIQGRLMAVADVFEALSAKDRPYKAPMPLSQAIKILGFMVKDRHLDGDVVDLLVSSGLVQEYATKHLDPKQVDL